MRIARLGRERQEAALVATTDDVYVAGECRGVI